jgi:hypothetical protein
VAAVVLAVQVKIFIYLYLSNRVRFFRYLVWAWGCYVGSKTFEVAQYFVPGVPALVETSVSLGTIGDSLVLASALALRWNYSIRPIHVLPVALYALYVAHYGPLFRLAGAHGSGWIVSGVVLLLALAGTMTNEARSAGFVFPETVDMWLQAPWEEFAQHRSSELPWMTKRVRRKVRNFQQVLHAAYPTVTDIRLTPLARLALKSVASWRYAVGWSRRHWLSRIHRAAAHLPGSSRAEPVRRAVHHWRDLQRRPRRSGRSEGDVRAVPAPLSAQPAGRRGAGCDCRAERTGRKAGRAGEGGTGSESGRRSARRCTGALGLQGPAPGGSRRLSGAEESSGPVATVPR